MPCDKKQRIELRRLCHKIPVQKIPTNLRLCTYVKKAKHCSERMGSAAHQCFLLIHNMNRFLSPQSSFGADEIHNGHRGGLAIPAMPDGPQWLSQKWSGVTD